MHYVKPMEQFYIKEKIHITELLVWMPRIPIWQLTWLGRFTPSSL